MQGRLNPKVLGGRGRFRRRAIALFHLEFTVTNKTSVIVMTLVGHAPRHEDPLWNEIDALPAPPGFCWRFVPEGPFAVQFRSILRMDARAVVVWVGADDAVHRAAKLMGRLLGAGLPIVIAVAEVHDPSTESVLRQAGALYVCANEAQQRLGLVLESILGPPSLSTDVKTVESSREVKMDAN
ncbi:MAG: hypothetical protein ABSC42_08835 [Tepidisphaeraceae bacterium]|jgi:hypothetical protein